MNMKFLSAILMCGLIGQNAYGMRGDDEIKSEEKDKIKNKFTQELINIEQDIKDVKKKINALAEEEISDGLRQEMQKKMKEILDSLERKREILRRDREQLN